MSKLRGPEKPSEARCYDVEMIRDFVDHLLWELRISHFETTGTGGGLNPELVDQLERYMRKRQTVGLLMGHQADRNIPREKVQQFREALNALRQRQIDRLEALRPLLNEALFCASRPTRLGMVHLGDGYVDDAIRRLAEQQ
jgi:hypothetical protein